MPGGPDPRGAVLTATDRWTALDDAFEGALPVLYRYIYRGSGGDEALTDDLTAATFVDATRGFAAGDDDRMALGPLHDAARAALARRARPSSADTGPPPLGRERRDGGDGGDDGALSADRDALRRLPYRRRIVLALRFHDHLPLDGVAEALGIDPARAEREVRQATAAFLAAADGGRGDDARQSDGAVDGADDERLRALFVSLVAAPGAAYTARLRSRLRATVRSAPRAALGGVGGPAGSTAGSTPAAAPSTEVATRAEAAGSEAPGTGVPSPRRSVPDPEPIASTSTVRNPSPRAAAVAAGTTPVDPTAGSDRSGTTGGDDLPAPLVAPRGGTVGGRTRVRKGSSPRRWVLPAVAVTAVALLAMVLVGGGGEGRDRAAAPPASNATPGGLARGGAADGPAARLVGAVDLPSPTTVGGAPPAPTRTAEVVARVHLGPGGPYMNGPYAIVAGDEGLWSAAVGDDGTWQAVRIDPATGGLLAQIRIPGRIPSDRSDHGIAVSGGYVWTPALRDGIFRIDAATNTPSGIVAVAGGVRGTAMDGGDGAVWAVGNDNVLRRIDARTTEVTSAAMVPEMGLMPTGVDLAYGGGTVWVMVADGGLRHLVGFDPVTLERRYHYVMNPLGLVSDAYDLAADGDRVVVTETWPGGVTVVDGAAGRIVAQHRFATAGIAIDGDRAWVMSPMDGRATVVWTRTGDPIASTGVPKGVETIVSTAEGGVWAAIPSTGELVRLRFGD